MSLKQESKNQTNNDQGNGRLLQPAIKRAIEPSIKPAIQPMYLKSSKTSSETSLPEPVKDKMENSFGEDFSDVNIHDNSTKAEDLGAKAFAQGKDVHFAPGEFQPNTKEGQELIGHELTHVVQQKEGKVQGGEVNGKDMVNQDPSLEKEADDAGKLASEGKSVEVSGLGSGVQMKETLDKTDFWPDIRKNISQDIGIWSLSLKVALNEFFITMGIAPDEKFTPRDAGALVFNWMGIGDQYEATMVTISLFNDLAKVVDIPNSSMMLSEFTQRISLMLDGAFNPNNKSSEKNIQSIFNTFKNDCLSKGLKQKVEIDQALQSYLYSLPKPEDYKKQLTLNWIKLAQDGDNGMDWDDDAGMIKVKFQHKDRYGKGDDNEWKLNWAYIEDVAKQGGTLAALKTFFGGNFPVEKLGIPVWYELDVDADGSSTKDDMVYRNHKYIDVPVDERKFTVVFNGKTMIMNTLNRNQKVIFNDWMKSKNHVIKIEDLVEN